MGPHLMRRGAGVREILKGGGLGPKYLCTKNGPTRFSQSYISFFLTPVSHAQANGTRISTGCSCTTTAKVSHSKNEVIVVCFLALETLGEPWATAKMGQHKAKLNGKRKTTCSTFPPQTSTLLALLSVLPRSIPHGIHFCGGGGGNCRQPDIRREAGGGGVWDPKVCVPKMARSDLPNCKLRFFPR